MAVEMGMAVGTLPMVKFQGFVHGLLIEGVGTGGVHLPLHGQLNDLSHALERRVAAFYADLSYLKGVHVGDQLQMEHVDGPRCEQGVGYGFTPVDPDIGTAHEPGRLFKHFRVAHNDGAAAVI